VWVKTFSRVVDFNNGLSAEISAIKSPYYQTILDKAKERQATICEYNLPDKFIGTRKDSDGYEEYVSLKMTFSRGLIAGTVMKRVEKVKWHHKNPWHEKYFELVMR
jgi:hypothetical protein